MSKHIQLFRQFPIAEDLDFAAGRINQASTHKLVKAHFCPVIEKTLPLEQHLPSSVRFTRPKGGMHLWIMFDRPVEMERLQENARKDGVQFAPGSLFFTDSRRASSLRLNFSANEESRIREGVKRLAQCIKKELEK